MTSLQRNVLVTITWIHQNQDVHDQYCISNPSPRSCYRIPPMSIKLFRLGLPLRPTSIPRIPNFTHLPSIISKSKMSTQSYTSGSPNEDLVHSKLFSVSGFKAVVTGGGTGIGLMITQALVANGATVYITGRRPEALNKVKELYSGKGGDSPGTIIPMVCDIRDKSALEKLAKDISEKEPKGLNLLVNNAGIAREKKSTAFRNVPDLDFTSVDAIAKHLWTTGSPQEWAETFETNVTAQFFTSVAFLPLLALGTQSTPGYSSSIVNITSISGVLKSSSGGQFAYSASKAAFLQQTQNMAALLAKAKIRVNSIAPGVFPSEMTADKSGEDQKSMLEGMGQSLPAGRTGDDKDMAAAILYLAGPGGVFLNGQVLYPDGGNILTSPARA
ncbi:short chain dehydrogenase/reductase [Geopyxis carbonaria]|nr:short chain dehydrogenase/reductase [Geopyxis carbonaria]